MDSNQHLLELKNLSVDYATSKGTLHALRDISFSVAKGKIIGIVGESGCGKSTLISSIMGLTDPNASITGQIQFKNKNLLTSSPKQWQDIRGKDISVIFQDPMLAHNPVLTIGKQLFDIQYRAKRSNKEKHQISINMLHKVGISDAELRLKQYPYEFSGGMRQRISIAMALMSKPSLLIADEPTTALDATLEVQILEILKLLQEEINCSMLFISHHLGVIAELCDEVIVMYAGELIEHGKTRDIFENPMHPYTKALIECDPGYSSEKAKILPTIKGEVPRLIGSQTGCIFEDRCTVSKPICKSKTPETIAINKHYAKCHLLS